jgi:menaquinone-dependent protoporphyrinogen oxidase
VKVLVTYGSHLGSTGVIAERIGAVLADSGFGVTVLPASSAGLDDGTSEFDAFVVGGGTYAGRWHPDAVAFIRRHADFLASKPIWLFSSGPLGSQPIADAREPGEMRELVSLVKARAHAVFAGAHERDMVDGSELGRLERFVAKRFIPEGDWRDWPSIEAWAREIARELTAVGPNRGSTPEAAPVAAA